MRSSPVLFYALHQTDKGAGGKAAFVEVKRPHPIFMKIAASYELE
jgi:hypothetical protein